MEVLSLNIKKKMNKDKEIKFNIPKNKEDKKRLLIDLEENVGVIVREEKDEVKEFLIESEIKRNNLLNQ